MRRFGFVLAALLLLGSACTMSEVDRNAPIDIAGTVRRQNGAPAAGLRVALTREADVGEVFTVFATLGLACVDAHTNVCLGARVARTGSDGRFAYELKGKDTQGFIGQASTMVLSTGIEPRANEVTGAITTYRFQVQTERLALPVGLWEPRLEGATGAFGARVTWTEVPARVLPPDLGAADRVSRLEFRRGDESVYTVGRARSGLAFDVRVLEDATGTGAVVTALNGEKVTDVQGRKIDVVLRSGARAYESPAGAPPSRGRACSVLDANGRSVAQSPCRLTDGEFAEPFAPTLCRGETGCVEPAQRSTVIDLGARRSLSLIVVRGCGDRCTVETSRNARTWRTAGVAVTQEAALRVVPPISARYLRVSSPSSIAQVREVSVWTGSGAVAAGPLFIEPAAIQTPPSGSAAASATPGAAGPFDGDDGSGPWRFIAVGVLSAVGGALAATLLSRRKRRGPAPRS